MENAIELAHQAFSAPLVLTRGDLSRLYSEIGETERALSLAQEAVEKARNLAKPGDVVVLTPGCASFDMFLDFEDRGRQFKRFVMELNG